VFCRTEPGEGEVEVVGIGGEDSEGIVMLYNPFRTYQWSTLCSSKWDDNDAIVVCKQLGFKTGSSISYRYCTVFMI